MAQQEIKGTLHTKGDIIIFLYNNIELRTTNVKTNIGACWDSGFGNALEKGWKRIYVNDIYYFKHESREGKVNTESINPSIEQKESILSQFDIIKEYAKLNEFEIINKTNEGL